jgi:shikimate-5-dehydrogenase/3-dehydroquinate dehydratase type I
LTTLREEVDQPFDIIGTKDSTHIISAIVIMAATTTSILFQLMFWLTFASFTTTLAFQAQGVTIQSHKRPSLLHTASMVADRNMFHEYSKPILLIGTSSGDGDELTRLAKSFLKSDKGLISLTPTTDKSDIIAKIESSEFAWPNVLVVDLKDDDDTSSDKSTEMVKSLYEDAELLSIFVNVEGTSNDFEETLVKYSDYEICIKDEGAKGDDDLDWQHIEWELSRIIARARLAPATPGSKEPSTNTAHLTMGENTFFLSLSFPDINQVEPYVEQMCEDVDAMEYRTDLLDCRDSRFDLLYGMQQLRKFCRPFVVRVPALPFGGEVLEDVMPICYTVRTQNQAGTYPDDADGISKMFDLLEWGLRGGVEVLDIESAWNKEKTDRLLSYAEQRYSSQILGSHHVVGEEVSSEEAVRLFQQCALNGRAHGAKVVLSIKSEKKDRMAHEAALVASALAEKEGKPVIPNVSLILGDVGSFSRVVNLPFTPVTHESLPFKAAPGQLTANEIMASRLMTNIVPRRRYAILGHNIAYSVSPQMQGAAFAATRLPYQYGRADVETVEEFVESEFFTSGEFGGCSVTIPHKQAIIPYVDVLSDSAKTIGSVNTLIVENEFEGDDFKRVIYGDNTDWKGIFNPLNRKLGGKVDSDNDFCLILGGGGTARAAAYAAQELGLKRLYYNRTPSKAQDLADSFGGTVVTSLEDSVDDGISLKDAIKGQKLRVVLSTLPAGVGFQLPDWLVTSFENKPKPIIFDVNYKPYYTDLSRQTEDKGYDIVRGSEMLWEQGVGQFEAWTKRTAPYGVMKTVVLQNCLPEDGDKDSFQ